MIFKNLCFTW